MYFDGSELSESGSSPYDQSNGANWEYSGLDDVAVGPASGPGFRVTWINCCGWPTARILDGRVGAELVLTVGRYSKVRLIAGVPPSDKPSTQIPVVIFADGHEVYRGVATPFHGVVATIPRKHSQIAVDFDVVGTTPEGWAFQPLHVIARGARVR